MNHTHRSTHSLWALIVVLGLALGAGRPPARAEEGWPSLPTDIDIARARDRLVAENTFTRPPCGGECDPGGADYDYRLCLAKACLNEFRMGPEIRESAVSEVEIVKAHDPTVASPAASAYVFFPYTLQRTLEHSDHTLEKVTEYHLARLDYGQQPYDSSTYQQWVPIGRGFEIDTVQSDVTSRAQRDAVLNSYFAGGWLLRGFPGEAAPAASPTPDPRFPCPWPAFFYPNMSFDGYLNDQPSLNYSREWMVANMAQALESYMAEGNEPSLGIHATDAFFVGDTYVSTAMPTGGEAQLQQMARDMARAKQASDPDYRLTPGDLLYLSLKVNKGNVRDALLTCHAALYRDGAQVNKAFIEQESVLAPLRNPAGYVDGDWSYKNPMGTTMTLNPRSAVGHDEQGVWYHFFGMAAVEFTDQYGAASYILARGYVQYGMNSTLSHEVVKRGHPTSGLGTDLADLAVAMEHSVRSNRAKSAPDVPKYCINYYAIAAGARLKQIMWSYFGQQPNPVKERFQDLGSAGDVLNADTTVTYRSPLSLRIEGKNGEWFTFDQTTGEIDGNTVSLYFLAFPDDTGGWDAVAVPFFDVASIDLDATGDGPVTLALYDPETTGSRVYEFSVQAGDEVRAPDGDLVAALNGEALVPSYETAGSTASESEVDEDWPAPGSGSGGTGSRSGPELGSLLTGVCGGLLILGLVGGAAVWGVSRRRPSRSRQRRSSASSSSPAASSAAVPRVARASARATARPRPEPAGRPAAPEPEPERGGPGVRGGWQLAVVVGEEVGHCFALGAEAHLGRSPDNDVCLNDAEASRQHALLICREDGCEVYDLDSRNGTWVNGDRISRPTRLQAGDTLRLGDTVLQLAWAGG